MGNLYGADSYDVDGCNLDRLLNRPVTSDQRLNRTSPCIDHVPAFNVQFPIQLLRPLHHMFHGQSLGCHSFQALATLFNNFFQCDTLNFERLGSQENEENFKTILKFSPNCRRIKVIDSKFIHSPVFDHPCSSS